MQLPIDIGSPGSARTSPADEGARTAAAECLTSALLDSRQRWRDLAVMSADFAFETDAAGRLTFAAPDPALGWPTADLLGNIADDLLLAESAVLFNPFRPTEAVRRRRSWLRKADGNSACLQFAAMPLLDAHGTIIGARGIAQDVTDQEHAEATVAAALHRRELVDFVVTRMQQEVLAPRMMTAALEAVMQGMGAEGCAIVDMLGDCGPSVVMHTVGAGLTMFDDDRALALVATMPDAPHEFVLPDGRTTIVAPSQTRFGQEAGLVIWRAPGARRWDREDVAVAASASNIIRVILEHVSIQSEMARQARTDPLTGLLNRRAFFDEVERRVGRLERDVLPGTLLFLDLDHFKSLNDGGGHEAGDEGLRIVADLLRATVRPSDVVARLGGDEFAMWLDGADEFAAAERANDLRTAVPRALAHLATAAGPGVTASIGIATRWPGHGEDIDSVMTRADRVMYEVKRTGRDNWRVAHSE
jgi:diguanylate cyclase (GGDEF)-like protein